MVGLTVPDPLRFAVKMVIYTWVVGSPHRPHHPGDQNHLPGTQFHGYGKATVLVRATSKIKPFVLGLVGNTISPC